MLRCLDLRLAWFERHRLMASVLRTEPHALAFNVVDVETTGLDPSVDRVLEVAVVRVTGGGVVLDEYSSRVAAGHVGCTAIHGLTAAALVGAPTFPQIAAALHHRLAGGIMAGHNVAFDLAFLSAEFARAGDVLTHPPALCTMALGRRIGLERRRASLDRACAHVGVTPAGRHSALGDARATALLLAEYLAYARMHRRTRWPRPPWRAHSRHGDVLGEVA
jgi:DNA polymerase-3 subunit epsilon